MSFPPQTWPSVVEDPRPLLTSERPTHDSVFDEGLSEGVTKDVHQYTLRDPIPGTRYKKYQTHGSKRIGSRVPVDKLSEKVTT